MADLSQLEAALVKADAAGDTEGAKVLAGEVRKMRTAAAQVEPVPKKRVSWGDAGSLLSAGEGYDALQKFIEHSAYQAGGAVVDTASRAGASPETAASLGQATNIGIQAIPTVAGGFAGKLAAPAVKIGELARDTMQSALKPTYEALRTGKADRAITTMLEEGINVTKGGIAQLRTKIGELNEGIMDAIKNSPATVDKNKVASALLIPLKRLEMQVLPGADVAAITRAWTEFLQNPLIAGMKDIPVQLAQKLKQGTYQALGEKSFGELKSAEVEAQKHLARGMKEEIAMAVPGVAGLNAQESKLINALSVTERRVLMEANKNPMGLSLLAKNPEAWAAFMADRSALFKSLVARALNANKDTIPVAAGAALGATAGYKSGQPQ